MRSGNRVRSLSQSGGMLAKIQLPIGRYGLIAALVTGGLLTVLLMHNEPLPLIALDSDSKAPPASVIDALKSVPEQPVAVAELLPTSADAPVTKAAASQGERSDASMALITNGSNTQEAPEVPVQNAAQLVPVGQHGEMPGLEKATGASEISIADSSVATPRSLSSALDTTELGKIAAKENQWIDEASGSRFVLSIDPELQRSAQALLERYRLPWGALVAVEPKTGRVLALSGYSSVEKAGANFALRSGFPAASLFKIITAAAAIERAGITGSEKIHYRGGNYTLNRRNYLPHERFDRRSMTLAEALGKSCNPAFARVALQHLTRDNLRNYAEQFGFNHEMSFPFSVQPSTYQVSSADDFVFARTAAGFGEVTISPLHAAMLMATIANGGTMMRPRLVDRIEGKDGRLLYEARSQVVRHAVLPSTAHQLLSMMKETVSSGTARSQFRRSSLKEMHIAGKTGTLSGTNPKGVYHWFIATAPAENPQIAVAALVVNPGNARIRATGLGRRFLEAWHDAQESGRGQFVRRVTAKRARG